MEVLLVTSRNGKRWVIPKGIVDPGLSAAASACKEAEEEAGIRGVIGGEALGSYQYDKWGGRCTVEVFLLSRVETLPVWPEAQLRQRRWFGAADAAAAVREPRLRELIERAAAVATDAS